MGPGRAGLLPLICTPTMFESDARQAGLPSHFWISAKFNSMAKQKNRLTTTRQVLARERFAYPVPTIHPKKTVGDETRILLTLEPTLHHSHLISTVSDPPAGESTSRSTKSKLPTLYLPWTPLHSGLHGSRHQIEPRQTSLP